MVKFKKKDRGQFGVNKSNLLNFAFYIFNSRRDILSLQSIN